MKNNLILFFTIILFISCRKPADSVVEEPVEDLLSYNHWGTFNTGGKCRDLDISDSILVAAANNNGFFVFSIDSTNQTLDTVYHGTDLDPTMGNDRAKRILISEEHNIIFILEEGNKIYMHKLIGTQYTNNWVGSCELFENSFLSTAIDDREDRIGIFALVKHYSNSPDWDAYSTSLVWKNLIDIDPDNTQTNSGFPQCELTYNFSESSSELYFSDSLLSVSNGELGVLILKQTGKNICVDENGEEFPEFIPTGDYEEDWEYCTNPSWQDGLGGEFEPAGGMLPEIFSFFDTPGSVNSLYSEGNYIFAALSTSNGCYMVEINDVGDVIYTLPFAQGYTINGVHESDGLIGLAAGHAGVLLYEWDGFMDIMYLGNLQTSYANKIKVQGNRVFVATEDGIDIFEIER